jgi:DNA-damage-inducible protein J
MHMNYNSSVLARRLNMAANALVQTRIDSGVKERAALVLEGVGLTISDAVRILLTRTANEGALPFALANDPAAHDAWFRARVKAALDDPRPGIPQDAVEAHFARRRGSALRKAPKGDE